MTDHATAPLLCVRGLTTTLRTDTSEFDAVSDVSITIGRGEAVALVGESGCGKSLTALSLMRLLPSVARLSPPTSVTFDGVDLATQDDAEMRKARGRKMAMIFQDPLTFLNPVMRIGDQLTEAIRVHNVLTKAEASQLALESLERVRITAPAQVMRYYPHQLSGGMRQRILIAMAISCKPELLIADEPTTALDVTIQAQIMDLLADLRRELGSSMLLITHDMGLVAEYVDRVYVMYAGEIVEEASVFDLFAAPKHPYTQALLKSSLSVDRRTEVFETIAGVPPNLANAPKGCRFHPRCPVAIERCAREHPGFTDMGNAQRARCLLLEEGA